MPPPSFIVERERQRERERERERERSVISKKEFEHNDMERVTAMRLIKITRKKIML